MLVKSQQTGFRRFYFFFLVFHRALPDLGDNPTEKVKAFEEAIKKMGPKDLAALPDLDVEGALPWVR